MSEPGSADRDDGRSPWRRWQMGELQAPPSHAQRPDEAQRPQESQRSAERRDAVRRQAELEALRERIRREAHEEGLAAGREQGHAEGLAQGLEEGRRQAKDEMDARLAETLIPLTELAGAFGEALETLDERVAEDLVDLALATGHQLAGEALKARPRQVLELVRALLHTEPPLVGQQRLWLHPLDHKLVQTHLGDELSAAGWTLQPDDQLSRGGCRVTSANGELDATWESRWQAVKAQVRHRGPTTPRSEDDQ
ncbi:flagellar assembly protein FliH [Halomonas saccharevitans]|uniref:Flagellar assembly protein FliH n=1 Tax=Halomonas saccharevitans TaxID=416872 RepID=A0A1I6YZ69_9GAMM|nr:flagellar assembly protein FliH [Halomonas saccharevitans]SFT55775.1 flagellar assembly protein FliH [Halomonas saccharevitans]